MQKNSRKFRRRPRLIRPRLVDVRSFGNEKGTKIVQIERYTEDMIAFQIGRKLSIKEKLGGVKPRAGTVRREDFAVTQFALSEEASRILLCTLQAILEEQ